MGKTRLLREALRTAELDDWQTAWGRWAEDAPHISPFELVIEDAARRAGLETVGATHAGPAELAREYARTAAHLAQRRKLIAVFDDLHAADVGSLAIFGAFVRSLADIARERRVAVLVLATLHEPWPGDALERLVQQLHREPMTRSLELDGLDEIEVHDLIRRQIDGPCGPSLLDAVTRATAGNPFFVIEVADDLRRRRRVQGDESAGGWLEELRAPLPVSAREAVARRLDGLGERTTATLKLAALLGEVFDYERLRSASEPADIDAALDAAVAAGALEYTGTTYRFTHGIVRTAILETMGPREQSAAHAGIAARLATVADRAPVLTVEIARHLLASGIPLDLAACELIERGGDIAMESFAWSTGARYFEAALSSSEYVSQLSGSRRGWLLAKAARANDNSGDSLRARSCYFDAIEHFREARDFDGWGLAILGWRRTFINQSEGLPGRDECEAFFEAAGEHAPIVTARLLSQEAEARWLARADGDLEEARRAVARAESTGDVETRAYAHAILGLAQMRNLMPADAAESFVTSGVVARAHASPRVHGLGPARLAWARIMLGDLAGAATAAQDGLARARRFDDWPHAAMSYAFLHAIAMLRGDDATAERMRNDGSMMIQRSGYVQAGFVLAASLGLERMLHGEFDEAGDALDAWQRVAGRATARSMRMLNLARRGNTTAARRELEERGGVAYRGAIDFVGLGAACAGVELAVELEDPRPAAEAIQSLTPVAERGIVFSLGPPLLLARVLAAAARLNGDFALARTWLDRAEQAAEQSGAATEQGMVALERARLLIDSGGTSGEAVTALESAMRVFESCGMAWGMSATRAVAAAHGLGRGIRGFLGTGADELSTAEREVLVEVSRGLDADQIADRLLLSERTVEAHLARIGSRLGVRSKSQARDYLARAGETTPSPAGSAPGGPLTAREREVLHLIAAGRTNQQIADELVISLHTAIRHVANILSKTGAANRTEAARWLRDEGGAS